MTHKKLKEIMSRMCFVSCAFLLLQTVKLIFCVSCCITVKDMFLFYLIKVQFTSISLVVWSVLDNNLTLYSCVSKR